MTYEGKAFSEGSEFLLELLRHWYAHIWHMAEGPVYINNRKVFDYAISARRLNSLHANMAV
jgi:hypothetical protein